MGWLASTESISSAPYIKEVQGTALINQVSTIKIYGENFTPGCSIICSAGTISNVKLSPELIEFDIVVNTPGSYPITVKSYSVDSTTWNSPSQPVLIARNALNLTNGWLDFRNITTPGAIKARSDFNASQPENNQWLSNSGYFCDSIRGLYRGSAVQSGSNTSTSFLKLLDYQFSSNSDCNLEFIFYWNSQQIYLGMLTPDIQPNIGVSPRFHLSLNSSTSSNSIAFLSGGNGVMGDISDFNQLTFRRIFNVGSPDYLKVKFQGTRNGGKIKYFKSSSMSNNWDLETNLLQEVDINFCLEGFSDLCPGVTFVDVGSNASILGMKIT